MSDTVYAYGAGCANGAVKIVRRPPSRGLGKNRYYVYPLEKIERVYVLGSGVMYSLIWSKAPVRERGSNFYTYKPYEDKDVAKDITLALINHVIKMHNALWHTTRSLMPNEVPKGFRSY